MLALALFAVVQLATIALERSRLGYYLRALRANHAAAASVGIDERRWKLIAFAWSAAMASAAGVLYAQYTLFVDPPSTIALAISIDIALIGVVGGIGTLWGPAAGALVYVVLGERRRAAHRRRRQGLRPGDLRRDHLPDRRAAAARDRRLDRRRAAPPPRRAESASAPHDGCSVAAARSARARQALRLAARARRRRPRRGAKAR